MRKPTKNLHGVDADLIQMLLALPESAREKLLRFLGAGQLPEPKPNRVERALTESFELKSGLRRRPRN